MQDDRFKDEQFYFERRTEQLVGRLERAGLSRRQVLGLAAASAPVLAGAGSLARAGLARAAHLERGAATWSQPAERLGDRPLRPAKPPVGRVPATEHCARLTQRETDAAARRIGILSLALHDGTAADFRFRLPKQERYHG
jgi:hypothetical protein